MISALPGENMNKENPMHRAPPTSKPVFTTSGNPLFGKIPAKNKQIPMNNNSMYQKPICPPLFNMLITGRLLDEKVLLLYVYCHSLIYLTCSRQNLFNSIPFQCIPKENFFRFPVAQSFLDHCHVIFLKWCFRACRWQVGAE